MVQYLLLYFTVLRYLKKFGWYRKIILRYDYKAGILLSTTYKVSTLYPSLSYK